ncbi:diamine N-acetyltransferase [Peribacillus simplex]|uniref:Diamine N-acetyltransferase n=1 Tax=Peribacillus simplex TaxID=1478 RepID=A0A9X8WNN7_9BACI|nr:GNAT family N-acetyltransferase [Peribacillus simplex]SIS15267.1 diamine N-acetyltransferase [Peribacillus simplex]
MVISIREIDKKNYIEVCELTSNKDGARTLDEEYICSNAMSLAESKYFSTMKPMSIYNDDDLIGFFTYEYIEKTPDLVTICRYMIDHKFLGKGLGRKSFKAILNYFKESVKVGSVELMIENENTIAKNLYTSFGFTFTGKIDRNEYYYRLDF